MAEKTMRGAINNTGTLDDKKKLPSLNRTDVLKVFLEDHMRKTNLDAETLYTVCS